MSEPNEYLTSGAGAKVSGTAPLVSIVVVTYNAPEYTRLCLEGVLTRTRTPFELIVVDNASEPPTREYVASVAAEGRIRLIQNEENRLWAAGCNQGLRITDPRSKYLLLLNSDIEVQRDDWLDVMLTLMESDPSVAIVGPQHHKLPYGPIFGFIDGHCLLFRRTLLDELGYLDEVRWPWFGAPAEMTVAAYAKGHRYKVVHPDDEILIHHGGKSHTTTDSKAELEAIQRPRRIFRELMQEYGIAEEVPPEETNPLLKPLRKTLEKRRFYYAESVGHRISQSPSSS